MIVTVTLIRYPYSSSNCNLSMNDLAIANGSTDAFICFVKYSNEILLLAYFILKDEKNIDKDEVFWFNKVGM